MKGHFVASVLKELGQFSTSLYRVSTYKELKAFVVFLFHIITIDESGLINDIIKQNIFRFSEKWQILFLNRQE